MQVAKTITVKCLSIGTLKLINFQFVPNEKLITFRCSKIWEHYSPIAMCLDIGTLKTVNFPFETNRKLMVLCVPILKHFRVFIFASAVHDQLLLFP